MRLTARLLVVIWIAANACDLPAEDVLGEPRLRITGPTDQLVYLTARYFHEEQLSRTVTSRLEISPDHEPFPLEFGYSGMLLSVVIPTRRQVEVQLLDGETVVSSLSSDSIGRFDLKHGRVPADQEWELDRVLLNDPERELARQFLAGLSGADMESLVSDSSLANIDTPTLEAYCRALNRDLGDLQEEAFELDGWLSWEGSLGARVVSGKVSFQHGSCHFTLMAIEHQLVDVLVESDDTPEFWFQGPSSKEIYIQRSLLLAKRLFGGRPDEARLLFSPRYFDEVTVEKLQTLSEGLRQRFGDAVVSSEYKTSQLGAFDPETRTRTLMIYHALDLDSGKRCISETNIVFPCGQNVISRGHLANIHLREAWQSAAPKLAESGLSFLKALLGSQDSSRLIELFHPEVAAQLDEVMLSKRVQQLRAVFGNMDSTPDWDTWRANQRRALVTAEGPIQLSDLSAVARLQFAEGMLIGATLEANDRAGSTLDLIADSQSIGQLGVAFWEKLLSHDLWSAYQILAPEFQQQLSLSEFRDLFESSGLADLEGPSLVRLSSVRLSESLDRGFPVTIAAYYIAELPDGSHQPLRCEFRRVETESRTAFELLRFSTEFTARFPVIDSLPAEKLIQALCSADSSLMLDLIEDEDREEIDPPVLEGFLQQLQLATKSLRPPVQTKSIHEYTPGKRIERLSCRFLSDSGEIPMSAIFQYGALKSFDFQTLPEFYFISTIHDEVFEQKLQSFASAWIDKGAEHATALLLDELQTPKVVEKLDRLLSRLEQKNGELIKRRLVSIHRAQAENALTVELELTFERGSVRMLIGLRVDAFAARISSVEIK